ncbi:MAG: cytochrome P450 [Egibacteraceae bacterium]
MPSASHTSAVDRDERLDEITRSMATPEFREDPYALYARMRRENPVYRSSQGIWYLTRYADVDAALNHPRLSNDSERARRWQERYLGGEGRELSRIAQRLNGSMVGTDPPDHTRLRKLVNKAFTSRRVQVLTPRIGVIVRELLDAAVEMGPRFDLIAQLAYPLPITVICELLGVPASDRGLIRQWTAALTDTAQLIPTGAALEELDQAISAFEEYLLRLVNLRRSDPRDDLLSALVTAWDRGDRLSEKELLSTCFLLLVAGHETSINLIGNSTLALLRHPDQMRRLLRHPQLIRSAIEELLRYDSPIQMAFRLVAGTVELGGQMLREGEAVVPVLAAANRDPARFPEPDRLDLARPVPRHVSFGNGPHFCIGARLARLEGEVAIRALVQRLPDLRLDCETVEWRPNPNFRGLAALPVAY